MPEATPASEIRFAQLAVEKKFVTPDQARECILIQRKQMLEFNKNYSSLADIMVEKEYVARHQANQIMRDLQKAERRKKSRRAQVVETEAAGTRRQTAVSEEDVHTSVLDEAVRKTVKPSPSRPAPQADAGRKTRNIAGYRIIEEIGTGRMGTVYKASQESMDRIVALKVLPPEVTDQNLVDQFLSEARAAGQLNHPNVIRVHDVGESNGLYYYSMEFVQGQTLESVVAGGGPIEPERAIQLMILVAQAIEYGHRSGLVHGEIRPEAVVITGEGEDQAKLQDLGLTTVDSARFLLGNNASFVSPEHVTQERLDIRSDLYSLGATFYYALTGQEVFAGDSPKEILQHHLSTEPTPILEHNPDLPEALGDMVMRLLAKAPEERVQTPTELIVALKDLREELANRKVSGRRAKRARGGKRARTGRRGRRRRR